MGVSASIPYDLEDPIKLSDKMHWVLHYGRKKDDESKKDRVCVFQFDKSKSVPISVGQKGIQRLRTIKHPYVLSFIESSEAEDSLAMVTEYGVPVNIWLEQHAVPTNESEKDAVILEVLWGLKNIIEACNFLHSSCKISHCLLAPHTCFVTKNGDWKLAILDLACAVGADNAVFRQYESILDNEYRCPERVDGSWSSIYEGAATSSEKAGGAVFCTGPPIDVFGIGKLISHVFDHIPGGGVDVPQVLVSPLKRMLSSDPKRRPACASILRVASFHSDQLNLMRDIGELHLKPAVECLEFFKTLKEKTDVIGTAACSFKILPSIGHSLKLAAGDFNNRDARETCRQIVHIALDLLATFSAQHKVEESALTASCLTPLTQLWTLADRSIRTALLKSLKGLTPYLPREAINKKIFDPLLTGFADSNSKLREETLKSLVHLVDKLDETNLQEKLVRCITNLQQDPENSIRTNATIFLGKIMPRLKDGARNRIMYSAYVKAMKDPFTHCRIAGLRAAEACLSLMEEQPLCTRLLPQISLLLVDKSPEVRELALTVLEASCAIMKTSHAEKRRAGNVSASPSSGGGQRESQGGWGDSPMKDKAAIPPASPGSGSGGSGLGGSGSVASTTAGWASWAVGGLAQAVERATIEATSVDGPAQAPTSTGGSSSGGGGSFHAPGGMQLSTSDSSAISGVTRSEGMSTPATKSTKPMSTTSISAADGWSDDDDIQFDDDEMDTANSAYTSAAAVGSEEGGGIVGGLSSPPPSGAGGRGMKLSTSATSLGSVGSDDGGAVLKSSSGKPIPVPAGLTATGKSSVTSAAKKRDGIASSAGAAKKAAPKPVVKKLAVTGDDDNWDDF